MAAGISLSKGAVAALPGSATVDLERNPLRNHDPQNELTNLVIPALAVAVLAALSLP